MEIFIWHKHLNKYSTTKLSFSDASNNTQVLYSNLLKEFQLKKNYSSNSFLFKWPYQYKFRNLYYEKYLLKDFSFISGYLIQLVLVHFMSFCFSLYLKKKSVGEKKSQED